MKKINKDYALGVAGVVITLLFLMWFNKGGWQIIESHQGQQLEKLIENL